MVQIITNISNTNATKWPASPIISTARVITPIYTSTLIVIIVVSTTAAANDQKNLAICYLHPVIKFFLREGNDCRAGVVGTSSSASGCEATV